MTRTATLKRADLRNPLHRDGYSLANEYSDYRVRPVAIDGRTLHLLYTRRLAADVGFALTTPARYGGIAHLMIGYENGKKCAARLLTDGEMDGFLTRYDAVTKDLRRKGYAFRHIEESRSPMDLGALLQSPMTNRRDFERILQDFR